MFKIDLTREDWSAYILVTAVGLGTFVASVAFWVQ